MIRRIFALILCLVLLPLCALADAPLAYRYSFVPGEALSGEGTEVVDELLNALSLEYTSWKQDGLTLGRAVLYSNGNEAISLRIRDSADGTYALNISLVGKNTLVCRKDQLDDVIMALVQWLADLGALKGESLEKIRGSALRLGDMLESIVLSSGNTPDSGIDLTPYLEMLIPLASSSEETVLDGKDPGCPGAVMRRVYHLSEEDMNRLIGMALDQLCDIPVISEQLKSGNLKIGSQVITDTFIRNLFASMHGETVLTLYENADGKPMKLLLQIPDITGLVEDPVFRKLNGIQLTIDREFREDGTSCSVTTLYLTGMESTLLTIRLEKGPGTEIQDPTEKAKLHNVGEMNSTELGELINSMWLTILGNALNTILVLPRCVFDMLSDAFLEMIGL